MEGKLVALDRTGSCATWLLCPKISVAPVCGTRHSQGAMKGFSMRIDAGAYILLNAYPFLQLPRPPTAHSPPVHNGGERGEVGVVKHDA